MKIKDWSKIREGTLLIVTWHDIVDDPTWLNDNLAQTAAACEVKTVGWFINDDKENIRLSWSIAEDGDKTITVIPKGCIRNVKRILYERK